MQAMPEPAIQDNGRILLSNHSVGNINSQYYIPEFISEDEERSLIRNIEQAPKTKWTVLSKRSLQNWGGLPGGKNGKDCVMLEEPIPQWLNSWCTQFHERLFVEDGENNLVPLFSKPPNHVLINKYIPGQGIFVSIPY